jgi:hypothetical protein
LTPLYMFYVVSASGTGSFYGQFWNLMSTYS